MMHEGLFLRMSSDEIAALYLWARRAGNAPNSEGVKKTILEAARNPARGNVAALAGSALQFAKNNPEIIRSAATVARAMLRG